MRGAGLSKVPMIYNTGANLLNVVGNYILIYGKCGFRPMGVIGAGYSTLISRIICCIWAILYMVFSKTPISFRNRYGTFSFEEARTDAAEWGRQVESAVGAHLTNRSVIDDFEVYYWRNDKKQECDYVLRKGQSLVAVEVKSGNTDNTSGFEKFKELYSDKVTSAFLVGPQALPLEDFFAIDLNTLFKN